MAVRQIRVLEHGSFWGLACPYCPAILQRTHDGTEADGLLAHVRMVHPGQRVM